MPRPHPFLQNIYKDIADDPPGTTYIYRLEDPLQEGIHAVRYVGKTHRIVDRYKAHCTPKKNDVEFSEWILCLRKQGLIPRMVILERIAPLGSWTSPEHDWIAYYDKAGSYLFNYKH